MNDVELFRPRPETGQENPPVTLTNTTSNKTKMIMIRMRHYGMRRGKMHYSLSCKCY